MVTDSASLTAVYSDESHSARLARKSKEAPFMPIGKREKRMNDMTSGCTVWSSCVAVDF
jgi:hypothetical protein